jgi:uncharacterized protein YdhG (YjbR/CyaY superfamily)
MTLMKPAKSTRRKTPPRGNRPPEDFNEYVATVSQPARAMLQKMRAAIRSALPPDAVEIISYRIPAFKQKKVLVWFAAFSSHCSLFPTAAVIEGFRDDLKAFVTSKGTIQFSIDRPLPVALIKTIVKARVAQTNAANAS